MGTRIYPTLTLMLGGTSLTAGRLCTPPIPWTYYLLQDMRASPYCRGPVVIINTGRGSQTSNFGASQAALMAPLRPTHVLMEDFGINDCAIGPVSIPQATANFNSMVASYRAANSEVVICHQTMSPASAGDANRTNLATYYDNGLVNAALNDLESLDNYYGTDIVPGGWPKPLDVMITVPSTPFSITPTSGFEPMAPGTTWNASDKSASIDLSVSLLTATSNAASTGGVRATATLSGSIHIEWTTGTATSTFPVMGAANSSFSLAAQLGTTADGIGLAMNGEVRQNNSVLGTVGFTPTAGDVIAMEIDTAAQQAWFMKGAVRSGPYSTAGITGSLYPAMSAFNSGVGATANFSTEPDGLHPLWPDAFELYSYPNILNWAERMMQAYWPD